MGDKSLQHAKYGLAAVPSSLGNLIGVGGVHFLGAPLEWSDLTSDDYVALASFDTLAFCDERGIHLCALPVVTLACGIVAKW